MDNKEMYRPKMYKKVKMIKNNAKIRDIQGRWQLTEEELRMIR